MKGLFDTIHTYIQHCWSYKELFPLPGGHRWKGYASRPYLGMYGSVGYKRRKRAGCWFEGPRWKAKRFYG